MVLFMWAPFCGLAEIGVHKLHLQNKMDISKRFMGETRNQAPMGVASDAASKISVSIPL